MNMLPVTQGKLDEALEVKRKGLAIEERVLAPDHPQMSSSLKNLAELLRAQVRATRFSDKYISWCSIA